MEVISDLIGQSFNNTVPLTSIWPIFRCANTFIKVDFPAPLEEEEEEEERKTSKLHVAEKTRKKTVEKARNFVKTPFTISVDSIVSCLCLAKVIFQSVHL